ncbi:ABC transporter ATP-binding protein [Actinobacillus succinogenes]|uniref:ABC transporter related n=1 Tax=Actinobacillus succinogenes (strain ATCC 55618 / DSM 22257 / CCUG 43843 / 130Z) TaxID=339671 RepID=A6VQ22_ACTSZ|nr:ABC transporter ATP-binding protein [Actinobacillus succinogenes]ABR75069.1 ABC transporter related [Actinobacillus succinogenes 130Z]PHI40526.1 ABC transporter ATP-binding protein [Actinobacillus succinogenes]
MATIIFENISKTFGSNEVLENLSLVVNNGECFTLLGPSGCGKTVLLRLLAGFEVPDSGRILIDDEVVADPAAGIDVQPDQRGLGVVFQDYAVWPHMTVFDNIAYPLKLKELDKETIHQQVMEVVDLVNLTGLEKRLPSQLSGGQQQRVALARALVAKPSLMLLDEPLNNLDANLREEMRFEIKELQKKLGITILYVTHDQEIALAISDRLAIMDKDGSIQQIGTPWEIYEKSENEMVFKFMGLANFIPVRFEQGQHFVGDGPQAIRWGELPSQNGKFGCRPSDIILTKAGDGLQGTIVRASFLGAVMDYMIEIDNVNLRTEISTNYALQNELMFKEGENCVVNFHDLLWFPETEQRG